MLSKSWPISGRGNRYTVTMVDNHYMLWQSENSEYGCDVIWCHIQDIGMPVALIHPRIVLQRQSDPNSIMLSRAWKDPVLPSV